MRIARPVLLLGLLAAPTAMAEPKSDSIEDLFALYMVSSGSVADGKLRAHVRVFNPYGPRPLPGVEVEVTLEGHDGGVTVVTGERGEAEAVIALPDDLGDGTLTALARARFRGVERRVESWLFLEVAAHPGLTEHAAGSEMDVGPPPTVPASRWPIQVDLAGWLPRPGLPSHAFVTTRTAAGEPVACDVEIRWRADDGEELVVARLTTDRHGLGRVEPTAEIGDGKLVIRARDAAGRSGEARIDHWDVLADDALVVDTPRTVHRRGEPLVVTLHPAEPMDDVLVEVRRGDRRLRERRLDRLQSPARLVFDAGDDLAGRIDVLAYSISPDFADDALPAGRRTVLYREPHGGEEGPERAGWTVQRFLDLPPDADVPADLDRLAELLVRRDGAYVANSLSTPLGEEVWEHHSYFEPQFRGWKSTLERAPRRAAPTDWESLAAILRAAGLRPDGLADPWGTPYQRGGFDLGDGLWTFELESAGRDRDWGSIDDFVVWSHSWDLSRLR